MIARFNLFLQMLAVLGYSLLPVVQHPDLVLCIGDDHIAVEHLSEHHLDQTNTLPHETGTMVDPCPDHHDHETNCFDIRLNLTIPKTALHHTRTMDGYSLLQACPPGHDRLQYGDCSCSCIPDPISRLAFTFSQVNSRLLI